VERFLAETEPARFDPQAWRARFQDPQNGAGDS
jgi:hypothetical protein